MPGHIATQIKRNKEALFNLNILKENYSHVPFLEVLRTLFEEKLNQAKCDVE